MIGCKIIEINEKGRFALTCLLYVLVIIKHLSIYVYVVKIFIVIHDAFENNQHRFPIIPFVQRVFS